MTKEEWIKKLKTDLSNRTGLGMYVLDTFFEEAAQLLAEHDAELIKEISQSTEYSSDLGRMPREVTDAAIRLQLCFPEGRFLLDREPVEFLIDETNNVYFLIGDCKTKMDVDCKVLQFLSYAASEYSPYNTNRKNDEFHKKTLSGINHYLRTSFTLQDMEVIYTYMGGNFGRSVAEKFINSGFDVNSLSKEIEEPER